jgi:hypothetical protein
MRCLCTCAAMTGMMEALRQVKEEGKGAGKEQPEAEEEEEEEEGAGTSPNQAAC